MDGEVERETEEETSETSNMTFISSKPNPNLEKQAIFEPEPVKVIALVKVISAVLAFSKLLTSML